jgi:hypothetical protein
MASSRNFFTKKRQLFFASTSLSFCSRVTGLSAKYVDPGWQAK